MTHSVTLESRGDVGVLRIDNPPVNALSPEVIAGIGRGLDAFEQDRALRALLVYCAGATFVAGADISFFDRADITPADFNRSLQRLESSDRLVWPEGLRLLEGLATELGVTRRAVIGDGEIIERLLYPMINEGMKIMEEGMAYRASDIDVVWTAGYGFPDHRGGPMFMADRTGLRHIVQRLQAHGRDRGDRLGDWAVSPLLQRHAAEGRRITEPRVEG